MPSAASHGPWAMEPMSAATEGSLRDLLVAAHDSNLLWQELEQQAQPCHPEVYSIATTARNTEDEDGKVQEDHTWRPSRTVGGRAPRQALPALSEAKAAHRESVGAQRSLLTPRSAARRQVGWKDDEEHFVPLVSGASTHCSEDGQLQAEQSWQISPTGTTKRDQLQADLSWPLPSAERTNWELPSNSEIDRVLDPQEEPQDVSFVHEQRWRSATSGLTTSQSTWMSDEMSKSKSAQWWHDDDRDEDARNMGEWPSNETTPSTAAVFAMSRRGSCATAVSNQRRQRQQRVIKARSSPSMSSVEESFFERHFGSLADFCCCQSEGRSSRRSSRRSKGEG